ncbi:hypothetical protein VHUM_03927 [Vanrija humicola]|uniref:DUF1275 domain protein n=1 Tax=Vanrija humicola TaxID=5417 RepID=A0A7D8YZW4_VANHU|nr:hypothetical protein VHUM_03927 [Vanrija humicola]
MTVSNGTTTYGATASTEQLRSGADAELPRHAEPRPTAPSALAVRLAGEVDAKACDWISVFACFLTGWTSAISFTTHLSRPGFQTGNVAQLAIAMARTFDPPQTRTFTFMKGDQQALTALVSFWLGTSLGRIGARIGPKRRAWLVSTSLVQIVCAVIAAVLAHFSGEGAYANGRDHPSWSTPMGMAALAFLSASLGLQGIVGKRIGSPMNTTVVLTTTWIEIFNDPSLFYIGYAPTRDKRVAGVMAVLVGAFIARALLGVAGSGGAIGVLCAFRLLQAVWWAAIPGPKP